MKDQCVSAFRVPEQEVNEAFNIRLDSAMHKRV
jgi:hypothetical protein